MQNIKNHKTRTCGLSLPIAMADLIETERQDISRSRFVLRILEKEFKDKLASVQVENSGGEVLENRPHQEPSNVSDNVVTTS